MAETVKVVRALENIVKSDIGTADGNGSATLV